MLALTRRDFYLGAQVAGLALTACRGPGAVAPAGRFAPASEAEFRAVAAATMPAGHQFVRFRWRTDDGQVAVSGTGAARLAPDSLRVDLAVRLGVGRATLILTGDAVQAEPAQYVEQLLPDRFALWAAFGTIRLPDSVPGVARLVDGARTFWRYGDPAGRVTTFELHGDTVAGVVRTEGDRPVARLALTRGADGAVSRARLTDLVRGAVFEVEFVSRQPSEPFAEDVWRLRP